jgi:hypothetical protein
MKRSCVILLIPLIIVACSVEQNIPVSPAAPQVIAATQPLLTETWTAEPTATTTPLPTPTRTPKPTYTRQPTDTPTYTPIPTTTLAPEIYPLPSPFLTPVAWGGGRGCPNPDGLVNSGPPNLDEALALLSEFNSGDPEQLRLSTDLAYWIGYEVPTQPYSESVEEEWLKIAPAAQSDYEALIRIGCGREILDLSFWVLDCRTDCADASRPLALQSHYFLINRSGTWLVWATYP